MVRRQNQTAETIESFDLPRGGAATGGLNGAATQSLVLEIEQAPRNLYSVVLDYFRLMKPGIIVLLLISTCCPMVLASGGTVSLIAVFWALLGGTLVSGSASAMNCILDRDIDAIMERTKRRPLPAGRVSVLGALNFSVAIGIIGLIVLAVFLNPLAAAVALYGHLFYVFIYSSVLKRTTPQNIVIGGAAGAIPPLVGWAGVRGSVDFSALLIFLVVFLWTPPHFWALALNKNSDYRRAGIPMLPVVRGERVTHNQMLAYAVLLVPATLLLSWIEPHLGWFSAVSYFVIGMIFAGLVVRLRNCTDSERRVKLAWDVFGFSLIYLAIFFVVMVLDSVFI